MYGEYERDLPPESSCKTKRIAVVTSLREHLAAMRVRVPYDRGDGGPGDCLLWSVTARNAPVKIAVGASSPDAMLKKVRDVRDLAGLRGFDGRQRERTAADVLLADEVERLCGAFDKRGVGHSLLEMWPPGMSL